MDELNLKDLTVEELKGLQCLINKELREKRKADQTIEVRSGPVKVVTKRTGDAFSPYTLKIKSSPKDYFLEVCSSADKFDIIKRINTLISSLEVVRNTLMRRTNLPTFTDRYNTENDSVKEINQDRDPRINPFYAPC